MKSLCNIVYNYLNFVLMTTRIVMFNTAVRVIEDIYRDLKMCENSHFSVDHFYSFVQ